MKMLKKIIAHFFYKVIASGTYANLKKQAELQATLSKFKVIGAKPILPDYMVLFNAHYISIGDNFSALNSLRLEAWDKYESKSFRPEITIGNNVSLGTDVHIGCINKVSIGNNVLMGSRIYISDHSHGEMSTEMLSIPPVKRPLLSKGEVVIQDDVWIGDGACILPGVFIGRGAVIGANTVVTKDVPARAVVAGVPGKVIKAF